MNIKKVVVLGLMAVAMAVTSVAAPTVTDVKAKQRYPWNGLVDITYTVSGDVSLMNQPTIIMTAIDENTDLTYLVTTFSVPPKMTEGTHTATWDTVADRLHIISDKMKILVSIEDNFPLYCLIDVSGGVSATNYPVTYLDAIPSGGWTTSHKTDYIVLRWCPAGTYMMQGQRKVTLTKPFYIGVFEVTQKQLNNVIGVAAAYKNMQGDTYPTGGISMSLIRGNDTSFTGKLMTKSLLSGIDLPTEAQWEYACRAGTITDLSSGKGLNPTNVMEVAYVYNGSTRADHVGSHAPNPWGLYDMHGNVGEWCLDIYSPDVGTIPATDPTGPTSWSGKAWGSTIVNAYVQRGFGWGTVNGSTGCGTWPVGVGSYSSNARGWVPVDGSHGGSLALPGFRICMTLQ